jgi:hypothetical protein
MGQKSKYLEKKILDSVFGNSSFPSNATIYVALFTTLPTSSSDTGTETSGGGYARKSVANNSTNFPASTITGVTSTKKNGTAITFANATGAWTGPIIGFGFYDASSAGNLLYFGSLLSAKTVSGAGASVTFPATAGMTITEA